MLPQGNPPPCTKGLGSSHTLEESGPYFFQSAASREMKEKPMTTRKSTKTGEAEMIGCWIEPAIVRKLEQMAAAMDRTRSAEIRVAIREHIVRVEAEEETKA